MNLDFGGQISQRKLIDGRYRPVKVLGRGGMGWVLLAEDSLLRNEAVVLKFLYPHFLDNDQARMRLRSELLLARRLVHPNVVRTYNFLKDSELGDHIIMEFVPGQTLRHILTSHDGQHLPIPEILRILLNILQGIDHAHAVGVIHLDLKPENVLLDEHHEIKIADFGLAQSLRAGQRASGLSGTPRYMAPEQFEHGLLGPQTDLYAIGIMAFELVTGSAPFQGDTLYALATQHCSQELPSLRKQRSDVPEWLEEFIRICTAKSSSERFQSASMLLKAIRDRDPSLPRIERTSIQSSRSRFSSDRPYTAHTLLQLWSRPVFRFSFLGSLVALFCLFARNIGWLHGFLLLLTLHLEQRTGQPMTLARKLFALKAIPSETYHEAINEAGAIHALLSIGKDPNEFEPGTHRTILVNLAEGGIDVDTLTLLLEFGADPNIRNSDGESALHAVRGPSSAEFAETLLRFGANPNLRDKRGATPLIAAVRTQNISLARVLLTAGSDPEAQDSNGLSAIDYARKIIDIDSRFFEILSLAGHEKSSARHARSTSIVSPTRRETQGEPDSEKAPRVSPMP